MFNFVSWNIRGASGKTVSRLIKDLVQKYHMGLLALFKAQISGQKADSVLCKLGMDYMFKVGAVGFLGGIWVMWDSFLWSVDVLGSPMLSVFIFVVFLSEY